MWEIWYSSPQAPDVWIHIHFFRYPVDVQISLFLSLGYVISPPITPISHSTLPETGNIEWLMEVIRGSLWQSRMTYGCFGVRNRIFYRDYWLLVLNISREKGKKTQRVSIYTAGAYAPFQYSNTYHFLERRGGGYTSFVTFYFLNTSSDFIYSRLAPKSCFSYFTLYI
jgi:hypothetical protein